MSDWVSTWMTAMLVMSGGAAAAFWFANQRPKKGDDSIDPEVDLEELQIRKETRVHQLRELKDNRDKIPDEEYVIQRGELERAAADILRQIDQTVTTRKKASRKKKGKEPVSFWQRSPQLKGILLGAGAVCMIWLIYPALVRTPVAPGAPAARPTRAANAGVMPGSMPGAADPTAAELEVVMKRVHDNPNDLEALKRGGAIFLAQGRIDAASMMIQRSLATAPQDPEVRLQQATLQAMTGDTDAAMVGAAALVADAPGMADAWYLHGMIAMRGGQTERARESFRKFVQLAPDGPKKARIQAILTEGSGAAPNPGEPR